MTDRELLELAAKAEGREVKYMTVTNAAGECVDRFIACWNPLTDDGDALRLAVNLQIFNTTEQLREFQGFYSDEINKSGMPTAATRRAIVTIAAHHGRVAA